MPCMLLNVICSLCATQLYLLFDPLLHEFIPGFVHLQGEVWVNLVDIGTLAEVLKLKVEFAEVIGVLTVLLSSKSSWTSTFSVSI